MNVRKKGLGRGLDALLGGLNERNTDDSDLADTADVAPDTSESRGNLTSLPLDLIERGHPVIVAADASGSRNKNSADLAFDAMRDWGALVLPTETIVYHLLARSGTDDFKKMLPLFK